MKRRRAREFALQILFEADLSGSEPDFQSRLEGEDKDVVAFTRDIVAGTLRHLSEIDSIVKEAAEHWVIERMAAVDRNILRAAAYELLYRKDIPVAVVINEAIEVAKKYSSAESAPFINGILDKIAKKQDSRGQGVK